MPFLERLRGWARTLMRDVHALYLAGRDPRVPWLAKLAAFAIAIYALSPIDLIPDFIPLIGYLDDLVLLPIAIWLVIKLIPPHVLAEHRATAAAANTSPASRSGTAIVLALWLVAMAIVLWLLWPQIAIWMD